MLECWEQASSAQVLREGPHFEMSRLPSFISALKCSVVFSELRCCFGEENVIGWVVRMLGLGCFSLSGGLGAVAGAQTPFSCVPEQFHCQSCAYQRSRAEVWLDHTGSQALLRTCVEELNCICYFHVQIIQKLATFNTCAENLS